MLIFVLVADSTLMAVFEVVVVVVADLVVVADSALSAMFLLQRSWLFFCLALVLWQVTNPSRILDCISLGTPFLSGTPYFCIFCSFGSGLPGYLPREEIGH